jgi:hypothetical protein
MQSLWRPVGAVRQVDHPHADPARLLTDAGWAHDAAAQESEMATTHERTLVDLETKFWQSMVDQDTDAALALLSEPALMVSEHGAMKFEPRGLPQDGRTRVDGPDLVRTQRHGRRLPRSTCIA